jgi:hypothetical protein
MALVALLTAGLIGGGIAGVSQFASADQPDLAGAAPEEPTDPVPPVDDPDPTDESSEGDATIGIDGEIVLDLGDGDPVTIDLGALDAEAVGRLSECIGLPRIDLGEIGPWGPGEWNAGDFPLDEFLKDLPFDPKALDELMGEWSNDLGDLGVLGPDGGSVTVTGPDGVSVVDLGENGSVTVTRNGEEITIDTSGDATVKDLSELFGDFGAIFEAMPRPEGGELPNLGDLPGFESIDPATVQQCIDEVVGG